MNSNRMLGVTTSGQAKSTEKLSSGYKVNRAADDAAGLSISEKMRRQIRGLSQASLNCQDGISCVQTAEGALNEVHDMLQRMSELAIKSANGTMQSIDMTYIQQEINSLTSEIDRVACTTTFNEQRLLDGSFTNKDLQVGSEGKTNDFGANMTGQQIRININALTFDGLAVSTVQFRDRINDAENYGKKFESMNKTKTAETPAYATFDPDDANEIKRGAFSVSIHKLDVSTSQAAAQSAITTIKACLQNLSTMRSALGAVQNRLEHTINNLDNVVENTQAAESQIRDTDMATEMVRFSNNNILAQAGQSMLAQANQSNQGVLSLLG
jgi:flagellin